MQRKAHLDPPPPSAPNSPSTYAPPCLQISTSDMVGLTASALSTHALDVGVVTAALGLLIRLVADAPRRTCLVREVDRVVVVLQHATSPSAPPQFLVVACAAVEFLAGLAADPTTRRALCDALPAVQVRG
jgi:hypothetical protein